MTIGGILTFFAPAKRSSAPVVLEQRRALALEPLVETLYDAVPEGVVILNEDRQIVFANKRFTDTFNLENDAGIVGLRLGEALGCVHAVEGPGGCGTAESCRVCGAVNAIIAARESGRGGGECRISLRDPKGGIVCLDLGVLATSFDASDHKYTIFAVNDISGEKRRQVLERIFFHDLLNTAGGIKGFSELMLEEADGEISDLAKVVHEASQALINEISSYKNLLAAENNELKVVVTRMESSGFLRDASALLSRAEFAAGIEIKIAPDTKNFEFHSDRNLLGRIVVNLLKNALEASRPGQTVTLGSVRLVDQVEFQVHNQGVIPEEIQLQLFNRSFSTKGSGRGLGAYSVKLLAERYLRGRVGFFSNQARGTVFWVRIPSQAGDRAELQ
ncbi:MAG: ATP-binding protein [Pseudomonadota bacterium]